MKDNDKKIVFIDTAPFIYFIEGDSNNSIEARDMFFKLINSNYRLITSQITDVEFKVLPKRNNQERKINAFESFLEAFGIEVKMLSNRTFNLALEIRVNYPNIKLVDAMQLAVALEYNCDYFITNDKQLLQFKGLNVVLFNKL